MSDFKERLAAQRKQKPAVEGLDQTFQKPTDDRARLTIRLPQETYKQLQRATVEMDTKVNPVVVAAIERVLREYEESGRLDV
ncbi:hypothetical protein [Kocuria sp.]|uniref:hypothetical protein n=1 Tax=Kocuria sp. TaxID=1871328 RepID=UPI0028AC50BE|nr:hypothetical protein [Kocuria sp.]